MNLLKLNEIKKKKLNTVALLKNTKCNLSGI